MDHDDNAPSPGLDPTATVAIVLGLVGLMAAGFVAFSLLKRAPAPMPPGVAADPTLTRGYQVYGERCVNCHGPGGRGDGPIARNLPGPPPRNLVEEPWKYGERPEQVLAVLENGVKDAQMPAFGGVLAPEDLKSVAAYVYQISGRQVPDKLRSR